MRQTRPVTFLISLALVGVLCAPNAWAGSPHFVSISVVRSDNSLTVIGKEAGLGSETQVHIELTATALCINPGGKHPKAVNKEAVAAEGDFPVQNGKADFSLTATASFQPDCTPPMFVQFSDVQVCDTEHSVCQSFPAIF
jgi:hypothetical protein